MSQRLFEHEVSDSGFDVPVNYRDRRKIECSMGATHCRFHTRYIAIALLWHGTRERGPDGNRAGDIRLKGGLVPLEEFENSATANIAVANVGDKKVARSVKGQALRIR